MNLGNYDIYFLLSAMCKLAKENWGGVRCEALKVARLRLRRLRRVEEWGGHRLGGLGERRKLPQWSPGQSPGRKRVLMHFEL